jgi:Ca-activated chloride channel family protein
MKALDYPEAAPYAEYGLSYVYFGLDEGEAALERLAAAREALVPLPAEEHRELIYRVHYNTGIILFWKENYTGAAAEFRKALETDGGRVEAKRNLELSLLSSRSPEGAGQAPPVDRLGGGEGADTLFEYIRWKERDRWKSREWVEDTSVSGPDY